MNVNVRVFAALKEAIGTSTVSIPVTEEATAADVLDEFVDTYPVARPFRSVMRPALADRYVTGEHSVSDGDEIAVITPVSGG